MFILHQLGYEKIFVFKTIYGFLFSLQDCKAQINPKLVNNNNKSSVYIDW